MKFCSFVKSSITTLSLVLLVAMSFLFSGLLSTAPAMAADQGNLLEEVTLEEVFQFLERTGQADVTVDKIFQYLDKDRDNSITKSDVTDVFAAPSQRGFLGKTTPEELVKIVDSNGDGYVSESELQSQGVSGEITKQFFQEAKSEDGIKISNDTMAASDFLRAVTSVPQYSSPLQLINSSTQSSSSTKSSSNSGCDCCKSICYNKGKCTKEDGCWGCMAGCEANCRTVGNICQ